jgi:histo-blood group ABO system transferase
MIAFMTIATGGDKYTKFVQPLIDSAKQFFPEHEFILFTDNCQFKYQIAHAIYQKDLGWPRATLMRYHAMLKQRELLSRFSHVFYLDVDMLVNSSIKAEEICADGMTVVQHPGYPTTFERNPISTAFVKEDDAYHSYYQGCFVGGITDCFIRFCETITKNIDTDDSNGVMAIYHDESHLNRYMIDNPPAKVLSPSYCFPGPAHIRFPERWMRVHPTKFVAKIRHLEKPDQGVWKHGDALAPEKPTERPIPDIPRSVRVQYGNR